MTNVEEITVWRRRVWSRHSVPAPPAGTEVPGSTFGWEFSRLL
jgi:hypothetical protein